MSGIRNGNEIMTRHGENAAPYGVDIAIQFDKLTKKRNGFRLGPIRMTLETGVVYALIGANGSGKSTLLKMCRNIVQPTSGSCAVFGLNYAQHEQRIHEQVAYVPEPFIGGEYFTLNEMHQLIHRWYPQWDETLYHRLVDSYSLPMHHKIDKLSQGMRKKVALTLAFSSQAPLLLLDEPTNGLDFESKRIFRETVATYMESMQRTVLMTSNNAEDIHQNADCILVLKDGHMFGPFEKDDLQAKWRQLWIQYEQPLNWNEIRGVFDYSESSMTQIITRNVQQTIADVQSAGGTIINEQPLPFESVLQYVLNDSEKKRE